MPLQQTSGNDTTDAYGGGVAAAANYIEDVFSTYLYTGTGAAQTITNNIDLSTKGGLTWIKSRSAATVNKFTDTVRGATKALISDTTGAQTTDTTGLTAFGTTGFTIGADADYNTNAATYVSWTFRKQPKFFDVVTYTGTGSNRTIAHSLGSAPGCIIVKRTDTTSDWQVYHNSLTSAAYSIQLNLTNAQASAPTVWNSTAPTSSVFSVGTDASVNASGGTYVAYLFAHNAGGFGLTGTDNVITCGSFTTDASGNGSVNLGYEPQFVLLKNQDGAAYWFSIDNMRGFSTVKNYNKLLLPDTSDSEITVSATFYGAYPTATGFVTDAYLLDPSVNVLYIAIRRGPMKVPTTGTSVFGTNARTGTGANATVTGGQTDDAVLVKNRGSAVASLFSSRLTGKGYLVTSTTATEVSAGTTIFQTNPWDVMNGVKVGTTSTIINANANTFINYLFKRAPSFMDVVCYTGTGSNTTQAHNLGVAPELWIVKGRSGATAWQIGSTSLANTEFVVLNTTAAKTTGATTWWNSTYPTSSVFSLGTATEINTSAATYVAYLFATCAGVSKVGAYTGNGTTQTINCGFTGGARFVLIKRTNSTGDWYIYDTARGMTTLTDPYWLANTTAAEVATLGSVTTVTTGFAVNAAILAAINTNAATYIFLAIA